LIIQPVADGYGLAGQTISSGGLIAVRLIKLDMQGEVQRLKIYKGALQAFANDILVTDSGYVVFDNRGVCRSATRYAWIVSLDPEGNVIR
jgi:hypothetical protein